MSVLRETLQQALALTRELAAGVVSTEEVAALLAKRRPFVEQAVRAKEAGEAHGDEERSLAEEIMTLDRQLVERLWEPRKDAFEWLAERDPKVLEQLPNLRKLAGKP